MLELHVTLLAGFCTVERGEPPSPMMSLLPQHLQSKFFLLAGFRAEEGGGGGGGALGFPSSSSHVIIVSTATIGYTSLISMPHPAFPHFQYSTASSGSWAGPGNEAKATQHSNKVYMS